MKITFSSYTDSKCKTVQPSCPSLREGEGRGKRNGLFFISIIHNRILQIILLFVLMGFQANAQKKFKKYLLTGSSQFVSGMLDGTIESISYHYERGFKTRVPNANDNFWNPELSWKNKYKNGDCHAGPKFPGSTTILVSTTDAYHLLRTGKRAVDGLTLAYYINKECSGGTGKDFTDKKKAKKKWKGVAKDFLVLTAIRCAGFHLTYSLIFKQQQKNNN